MPKNSGLLNSFSTTVNSYPEIKSHIKEILQREMHLGRSMELLDLFADLLGVLMGYFTYQKIKNDYF
jgi:hypothetical protein